MPPPQCPECGRFLATAFVEQIKHEPAPCPRCGTELSLEDEDDAGTPDTARAPDAAPPVPPPSATLPDQAVDAEPDDEGAAIPAEVTTPAAATEVPTGEEDPGDDGAVVAPTSPAVTLPEDVEPEPTTSVRPPDMTPDRDPLEGWDELGTTDGRAAAHGSTDPAVLAAGAGIGLVLGLLLGGREHRGLGALLGAALGAVVARLRGG